MTRRLTNLFGGCHGTDRDKRNNTWVSIWALVWMASWVGIQFGIGWDWLTTKPQIVAAAMASLIPAAAMVAAYRRFLREADELRRKIELDALAVSFGVGVIGGMTYFMLAQGGLLEKADFLWVVVAMLMTHPLGVWIGHRRYS